MLVRAQRECLLKAAFAFRSVRYETAAVLAGVIPICLLVKEDARCYHRQHATADADANEETSAAQIRLEERQATIHSWQEQWDADAAAPNASRFVRWAHRVIPNIELWHSRKHGDVNFALAQILSGHGFFRDYLCRMRFTSTPECPRCSHEADTAEHAFFHCPAFAAVRHRLLNGSGIENLSPENLASHLLRDQRSWSTITELAAIITSTLQRQWNEERANLAATNAALIQSEDSAARQAVLTARNQRRNKARRIARAVAREERRRNGPLVSPSSLATLARRVIVRERVRRHRARIRQTQQPEQEEQEVISSLPEMFRSVESRSYESRRQSMSSDEDAAVTSATTSGR